MNPKIIELIEFPAPFSPPFPECAWATHKGGWGNPFSSVQSLSRVRLRDPMDRSMPGLPAHHQLPVYSNSCPLGR